MSFVAQNALPIAIVLLAAFGIAYGHFAGKRLDREREKTRRLRREARRRGRHVTTARSRKATEEKHAA